MQRLSAMDASFWFSEDGRSHNDIAMVLTFDGDPPTRHELARFVEARLHQVPLFRKRVREVPMGAGLPVWVDDTSFAIDRHVLETPIRSSLDETVGAIMSSQLDRNVPLWQVHLLPGAGDEWAVVVRMHHAMVDGVTSIEILRVLLSRSPEAESAPAPPPWQPAREPTDAELLAAAAQDAVAAGAEMATAAARSMLSPPTMPPVENAPAPEYLNAVSTGLPVDPVPLTGSVSAGRVWSRRLIPLQAVKDIRRQHGGTVNDVVLALSAAGFTRLLRQYGVQVKDRTIMALAPVSLRDEPDTAGGNQIGGMPVRLPLGDLPLAEVLARVTAQTSAFKKLKDLVPADAMTDSSAFVTPALLISGVRAAAAAPALLQTVVTNVPGPQYPLYLAGRRLRDLSACIALWSPLRIAIGVLSYDGNLTIAAVADAATFPSVEPFLSGVAARIASSTGPEVD